MSKDDATPPKQPAQAAVNVDAMVARLPSMSDAELATLHANATRLKESGTKAQQTGATMLLPEIEAERAKRPPPAVRKPPGRKAAGTGKGKAKAKAEAKAEEPTDSDESPPEL